MDDYNKVGLAARLTKDPELVGTSTGSSVLRMRVASTKSVPDGSGGYTDAPNYFDVTVFGKSAETCARFLTKGSRVLIDGRLEWREWTAKDGQARQGVGIVASRVYFLDTKADREGGGRPAQSAAPSADFVPDARPAGVDDDIPF